MKSVRFVVTLAWLAVSVGGALAQPAGSDFPNRPLRYIVAFPPGGASDIIARIVAPALTEGFGQQVVVDNRSGAAGTIGAEIAARATPDGYTLFGCNIASLAVSPALYKKLGYDPAADFSPIGLIGGEVQAMFATVPTLLGSIRSGKARVLGVTSKTRVPELPDVPTIAETGMPDFEVIS